MSERYEVSEVDEVESKGVNAVGRGAEAFASAAEAGEEEEAEADEEGEEAGGRVERKAEMREGEEMEMGRGVSMLAGVRRCSMRLQGQFFGLLAGMFASADRSNAPRIHQGNRTHRLLFLAAEL